MWYLAVFCLFCCASLLYGAPTPKQNATEKKELVHHVFGPLSVTTADEVDLPVKFLQTRSVGNQTSNDALVEQIKALSSYINSQQGSLRRKRQAGGPTDKLTVVNLEGNIKDVNLGPLRVTSNQGT